MKIIINPLIFTLIIFMASCFSDHNSLKTKPNISYGENHSVGKYAHVNGAQIYYEDYGEGQPLLIIHGNGGSIRSMSHQIEFFKLKYRVIVVDSRGHGKSELNTDNLTYKLMAQDMDSLVKYLNLGSINIIGISDGGIIGLLMGIEKRSNINKIVAMGANIRPDDNAVYSWAQNIIEERMLKAQEMMKKGDHTKDWALLLQRYSLLLNQPNISHSDLNKIVSPVLIMAGDRDIIKNQHSVEIFENIPNSQLSIMPGETHFAPKVNPELFNNIVLKFLSEKFTRPNSKFKK